MGVANDRSIAWAIAKTLYNSGAKVALTYQGEVLKKRVDPLAKERAAMIEVVSQFEPLPAAIAGDIELDGSNAGGPDVADFITNVETILADDAVSRCVEEDFGVRYGSQSAILNLRSRFFVAAGNELAVKSCGRPAGNISNRPALSVRNSRHTIDKLTTGVGHEIRAVALGDRFIVTWLGRWATDGSERRNLRLLFGPSGVACHVGDAAADGDFATLRNRSEEHTSELQSRRNLVCRLLLEKKKYNFFFS